MSAYQSFANFFLRPEEHTGIGHTELMTDYRRRLTKRLRFTSAIKTRGDHIFDSIAKKLELKVELQNLKYDTGGPRYSRFRLFAVAKTEFFKGPILQFKPYSRFRNSRSNI